jgi:hypothetical protein
MNRLRVRLTPVVNSVLGSGDPACRVGWSWNGNNRPARLPYAVCLPASLPSFEQIIIHHKVVRERQIRSPY